MSKVIQFLESVGAAPALLPDQYAALVAELDVGNAQRDALIGRDTAALGELLGGRSVMWCTVFEPQRDPQPEQLPDQDGEQPEGLPDEDSDAA